MHLVPPMPDSKWNEKLRMIKITYTFSLGVRIQKIKYLFVSRPLDVVDDLLF